MKENFVVASISDSISPSADKPFVVEVMEGQPVRLKIFQQEMPERSGPSAAIVMVPEETPWQIVLSRISYKVNPKIGVILTNQKLDVLGVFGPQGFEPLPGEINQEIPHKICKCPFKKCDSPPVFVFQKGQEVPLCPTHNIPRVCQ